MFISKRPSCERMIPTLLLASLLIVLTPRSTFAEDEPKEVANNIEDHQESAERRINNKPQGLEPWSSEPSESAITVLSGQTEMVIGGTRYLGDYAGKSLDAGVSSEGYVNPPPQEAITLNYRYTLDISTTFDGLDLLFLQIRGGNFGRSAFGGYESYVFEAAQGTALDAKTDNLALISRLWYQKPIVNGPLSATVFVGPRIRNTDMLAVPAIMYGEGDGLLQIFKQAGIPGAYVYESGAGAGIWLRRQFGLNGLTLSFSNNYVAPKGAEGDLSKGGIGTSNSRSKYLSQLAIGTSVWQVALAYAYTQSRGLIGVGTPLGGYWVMPYSHASTIGVSGFWQPRSANWIPTISAGFGTSWFSTEKLQERANHSLVARKQNMSWMLGLEWSDLGKSANTLGFAVGGPQWVVKQTQNNPPNDQNLAMELWYRMLLSDKISVTPSVFYLSRPFGELTGAGPRYGGLGTRVFSVLGGLIKIALSF